MLNLKLSHRATTPMREAFESALRKCGRELGVKIKDIPPVGVKIAASIVNNAGVYRRPDVTLNVSTKTWNQLKQLKAV